MTQVERGRFRRIHLNGGRGGCSPAPHVEPGRHTAGWERVAMALVILCMILAGSRRSEGAREARVMMAANESQTQQLEDGTVVSFEPESLRVEFTDQRRAVHLSHGKAVFDVATDGKRPFVV